MPLLEVCIDNINGALAAAAGGADRIELCAALNEGGLTPSAGMIKACRAAFKGALMVIIRPRGGDFVYSEEELSVMEEDVRLAKLYGADGVVFGCLRPDGTIDTNASKRLWAQAQTMELDATFHRAFDMTVDPLQALDALVALGIPRVLTSGCAATAVEGTPLLGSLVRRAAGRIVVMAGGGVTPSNAAELMQATGVPELHSSAKRIHVSEMQYRRLGMSMVSARPPQDYEWAVTDVDVVRALVETLSQG